MSKSIKGSLDRRTFLKVSGIALTLPFMEAMNPIVTSVGTLEPPKRMLNICTTLGLHPPAFFPKTPGPAYESTEYLDLLKAHRNDYTLFSGLSHADQTGRQAHNSEITWLTGARNPGLGGFKNSISVDQYAAGKLGYVTRFPSVVLSSNRSISQSYTASGVMVPAETSPAKVFTDMFLQGKPSEVEKWKRDLTDGRSILDGLLTQTKSLRRNATAADKERLDAYFESVRTAERDITEVQAWLDKPKPKVNQAMPADINDSRDLIGRTQLLMNMIPLILQTDSSRVISVMIQDHSVVPKVDGVSKEHHNLSHHGFDPDKIEQLKKIEMGLVRCFSSLLTQLKDKKEADGSLLDNTTVLFGSNLGNANSHDFRNLPIILAGGGFQHGKYITYDKDNNTPFCNLFVTMLNNMGIETESFAQSSGILNWS